MKITKKQLTEIIKEELSKLLREEQIDELGLGRALKGMGGAIKGKAFDKIKGMKGPVAQHTQAQKQIQGIVTDMIKKDPDSAVLYAQFLTKLIQSVSPAKTGAAGFEQ